MVMEMSWNCDWFNFDLNCFLFSTMMRETQKDTQKETQRESERGKEKEEEITFNQCESHLINEWLWKMLEIHSKVIPVMGGFRLAILHKETPHIFFTGKMADCFVSEPNYVFLLTIITSKCVGAVQGKTDFQWGLVQTKQYLWTFTKFKKANEIKKKHLWTHKAVIMQTINRKIHIDFMKKICSPFSSSFLWIVDDDKNLNGKNGTNV